MITDVTFLEFADSDADYSNVGVGWSETSQSQADFQWDPSEGKKTMPM